VSAIDIAHKRPRKFATVLDRLRLRAHRLARRLPGVRAAI